MKKIALIVDSDSWAFANIARQVKKNVTKYEFKIIPSQYFNDDLVKVLLCAKDCDLLHFFWRGKLASFKRDKYELWLETMRYGMSLKKFKKLYFDNKIVTTAVYDHLFENDIAMTNDIVEKAKDYYVCSNKLNKKYHEMNFVKEPSTVITDGVSLEKFYPINLDRFKNIKKRNLVVGWVGNSAWEADTEDFKGVNTILKPTIEKLSKDGYKVERFFADKTERMIPHDKMVEYYSKIDVLVCTSKIEGTPNPVLEAMACGVPVISTDVGIVNDALGKLGHNYILEERTPECLYETFTKFIKNLDKIEELSKENLKQIKDWEWKLICKKFEKFFDKQFEEK